MINISVSEPVWQALASRGKFGETEDDVLRRAFNLPANSKAIGAPHASPSQAPHPVLRRSATGHGARSLQIE